MENRKQELKKNIEELTRRSMLEAAMGLVQEDCLSKLTMDKVAERAGFAKGTLYLYFKNKKELLVGLVCYAFDPLDAIYQKVSTSDLPPLKKLEELVRSTALFVEQQRSFLQKLEDYALGAKPADIIDPKSWYWEVTDVFTSVLQEANEQGHIRPINSQKAATYLMGAMNTMVTQQVLLDGYASAEEAAQDCSSFFIGGILPR